MRETNKFGHRNMIFPLNKSTYHNSLSCFTNKVVYIYNLITKRGDVKEVLCYQYNWFIKYRFFVSQIHKIKIVIPFCEFINFPLERGNL